MIYSEIKSYMKIILEIILSISLLICFAVSIETEHIDSCHDECCLICSMIHTAIRIVNSVYKVEKNLINIIRVLIIQLFTIELCVISKKTMISEKVRLNE